MATDNREFWNMYADEWSHNIDTNADVPRNEFIFPTFVKFTGAIHGKKIIDLGCGEGGYARHYASQGNEVMAVDYAQAMIEIASKKSRGVPAVQFICDDLMSLGQIRDADYDVALAPMSLMDCPSLPRAFETIARVLRSRGQFFASVLHPCFFTISARWEIEDGNKPFRKIAGYFADEAHLVDWTNSILPDRELVKSYVHPHRLEHYLNGALAVGLQLVKIAEPPIPREYLNRNGSRHEVWAKHAALILLMHFTKR